MSQEFSRRKMMKVGLTGVGAVTGATVSSNALAKSSDNLFAKKEWNQFLGAGVDDQPYGMPSAYERNVVRRHVDWLTASTESSVNFTPLQDLEGFVTPNGLHFVRHHGGRAEVDPKEHRLMIHGLVDKPLVFSLGDLKRLPVVSKFYFIECAANGGMEWRGAQLNGCQFTHGMVSCCLYTGVKLTTLMEIVGIKPNGKWVMAEGADSSGMNRSIPMEKIMDDCMIAWAQNGEALRPDNGYPMRLVVPGFEGNMWVKWIRRLEVGDMPWFAREETSKYTDLLEDGKARMFTWVQDANSVITRPSPEKPWIEGRGLHRITGLAWSGRGTVKGVDISLDGGRNWIPAELEGPVFPKCLTRFNLPFDWRGEEHFLQSRAYDDTGYIQPTFAQNRKNRGVNSIYHNNSIHTWHVKASGDVENVQLMG